MEHVSLNKHLNAENTGRKIFYQIIKDEVEKYSSEYVYELRCGYGN